MINMFVTLMKMIFTILKYPLYLILIFLGIFSLSCFFFFIKSLLEGKRLSRGAIIKTKKRSTLIRIFFDTPKQFIIDLFDRQADFFQEQGLIIFEGRQGAGKTVSLVQYAMELQKKYPKSKCISNLAYSNEDDELKDYKQLLDYKNDKKGVIVLMDELQNWFSSNDSKNFPPEMLTVITQNRKNRRIILRYFSKFLLACKSYSFANHRSASLYDASGVFNNSEESRTNFR